MARKQKKSFRPWAVAFGLFSAVLAVLSVVNLSGHNAPVDTLNDRIVDDLAIATSLPAENQLPQLNQIRNRQEQTLARKPPEPFAWARLSYLRLATGADEKNAFAALRLSDLVSPQEPRQLPERALMWRHFHDVEDQTQQAYQTILWQRAFKLQGDATWALAVKNNIVDEIGEAIKQDESGYYDQWQARKFSSTSSLPH